MPTFLRRWPTLLCGLFVALLLGPPAAAQSVTGNITGTVTDASGGVVVNATVTLINEKTGETRNLNSNEDGRFNFAAVQPGVYTVKVEQQGFQTLERRNTVLSANENLALGELPLTVGQVTEVVTTVASGATVETESSDLTARLTSDQIALISTKGRDITSLLRLIPGTSNENDIEALGEGFGTDLPIISGQRGRATTATVDGLNASEPSGSNKISMSTNMDAIGEVKILRNNYAAEYGNNGGAIINIVTKGGGKDYRGTAYYFLRNEALNASPFFSNKAGLPRPLYRHNTWGFNFGGPLDLPRFGEGGPRLWRNKANFFVSLEKPHTITPTDPAFVTVPTALERAGDFSQSRNSAGNVIAVIDPETGLQFPGNRIPQSRWNSSGLALLNVFPLPNTNGRTSSGTIYNYVVQRSVDVPKTSLVIRFDFRPTSKDTVYWKHQWFTSDNMGLRTSGWPDNSGASRWGLLSHYLYKDNGWSANWVRVISPRLVHEFTFGMRGGSEGFIPHDGQAERVSRATTGFSGSQLFPGNNNLGLIPRVTSWSSVVGTPARIDWLSRWGEVGRDYIRPSFSNNLSWTRGSHSLKFGSYFERLLNGEARGGDWSGSFSFSNSSTDGFTVSTPTVRGTGNTNYAYANALLGNFNSYSEQTSRPFTNLELRLFQWYAQDQWKMRRNVTVNYGMRWGYHSPFFQRDEQGSNFVQSLYSAAGAPLLYLPFCTGLPASQRGVPAFGSTCATNNQRAIDPRVLAALPANTNPTAAQLLARTLVRAYVPGTGSVTNGLAVNGGPNTPKGFRNTTPINWEPRIGVAWDIFGKQQTVLRAMGGVYHSPRTGGGTTGGNLVGNPPFQRTLTFRNANINDLATLFSLVSDQNQALFPTAVNAVEQESKTPTIYNFSLGVQQDIGFGTVLEASYVGSLARHLGQRRNINLVPAGTRFTNCPVVAQFGLTCNTAARDPFSANGALNNDFLRPYRGYADINRVEWGGTSNYNSLQVQVNRRYAQNFQYGLAYTWSRAFDYANDDSSDVNQSPYRAFNYGPSDFDQHHILTINYIWDVPIFRRAESGFLRNVLGNWQISGTTSFATGKPKDFTVDYNGGTVTVSANQPCPGGSFRTAVDANTATCTGITDFTGGQLNAAPVVLCDPNKNPTGTDSQGTPLAINPNCFGVPARLGDIGNMGRNFGRRPSIFNNDLAFFKNINWGEKRQVQLRWEIYNIFNHTNFSDFDGGMEFTMVQINPGGAGTACNTTTNLCRAEYRQTDPLFGAVTAARSPRVMQGSIRINF
ncbi:MAG TPA: carboxypeptidase regulatory-like domain-containing protein [Pyrinomonadaceae bacterium]